MLATDIIADEEGFRSHPYLCSEGYVTVGYGTKLHKHKGLDPSKFTIVVDRNIGMQLLKDKVNQCHTLLSSGKVSDIYKAVPEEVKTILVSMAYQIGYQGLTKFHRMWGALEEGNFGKAADEMLDSKWAKNDSPARALRHSIVVRSLSYDVYDNL